jgi:perosamine synthetase
MIPIAKPYLTEDEAQAAHDVILSGWVTQGPKVAEFEEKFAQYVGSKYAVAVSSCTTALHLSLIVAGIGKGDEVICPSMSFIATANAIVHAGATPVFAEVNEQFNLDITHTESLITAKTKAILVVHQLGMPADIDAFTVLCKKYNLTLLEDAACAIGSEYKGKKIGSHSDLVCFSFHPRKVITTGDGGMITTSNEVYAKRLKTLRQHAMSVNDLERHTSNKIIIEEYPEVGYNYRMTDIQAAIGIKQLEKLDWIVKERRTIAKRYYESLQSCKHVVLPTEQDNQFSNYQSYCIRLTESSPISRDDLMQKMHVAGIATRRSVMMIHKEKAYYTENVTLPNTSLLSMQSLIIPLYVGMTIEEQNTVITAIKNSVS